MYGCKRKMEYVYGVMLLHAAGKEINEANLKKVMTASGIKVDDAKIKAIVSSLEGVNIEEAIKTAAQISVPSQPTTTTTPTSAEAGAQQPKEGEKGKEKKTKEEEEKAEEEAATGLASLFG